MSFKSETLCPDVVFRVSDEDNYFTNLLYNVWILLFRVCADGQLGGILGTELFRVDFKEVIII